LVLGCLPSGAACIGFKCPTGTQQVPTCDTSGSATIARTGDTGPTSLRVTGPDRLTSPSFFLASTAGGTDWAPDVSVTLKARPASFPATVALPSPDVEVIATRGSGVTATLVGGHLEISRWDDGQLTATFTMMLSPVAAQAAPLALTGNVDVHHCRLEDTCSL
jgi:hypothetical protein